MKRSLALIGLLVFALSATSYAAPRKTMYSESSTSAPDRVGQWDMGLFAGGAFNSDSDSAAFLGGNVTYGVTPWLGLGVEAGWQEGEADNGQDISMIPVLADFYVRFPNAHHSMVPYGVLGLGVIVSSADDTSASSSDTDDTAFGWKIGAGIDWFLNDKWLMNFELAYYDTDPDLANSIANDFSFWSLIAGVKYIY